MKTFTIRMTCKWKPERSKDFKIEATSRLSAVNRALSWHGTRWAFVAVIDDPTE